MSVGFAMTQAEIWLRKLKETGPNLTEFAHVKTAHEAQEFAEEPSLEELADVIICLVGASIKFGWSQDQISEAILDKVDVNKLRTWHQKEDGSWQHV